jgi:hypothetical protein
VAKKKLGMQSVERLSPSEYDPDLPPVAEQFSRYDRFLG